MTRAFIAHPKSWTDEQVDGFVAAVKASLPSDAEVVPGRDDYAANIASEGHVSAWVRSVTRRRDVDSGRRYFDLIVATEERVGKATADIARDAIAASLPIVLGHLDADGTVRATQIVGVETVDSEDFFTGWLLRTAG